MLVLDYSTRIYTLKKYNDIRKWTDPISVWCIRGLMDEKRRKKK